METQSIHKNIRTSPRKLRLVADVARKLTPVEAVEMLPYLKKRASEPLVKAISSTIANAKQKGANPQDLTFKEIQINEGRVLKRGRAVSRGMWHPILKRTSHIRIVVTDEAKKPVPTIETKIKKEKEEKNASNKQTKKTKKELKNESKS